MIGMKFVIFLFVRETVVSDFFVYFVHARKLMYYFRSYNILKSCTIAE